MRLQIWLWGLVLLAIPAQVDAQQFGTPSESSVADAENARPVDTASQDNTTRRRSPVRYAANERKKTAQDRADDCVLLLIQSGLGMNTSDAIRKSLAKRFTFSVVTMRDITSRDLRPHLLLTLARDRRGTLSALFWSSNGQVEVFSAEAPRQPEALLVAAVTLASTVVDRFVGEGKPPPICNSRVSIDGDLFAKLGRGVVIPAYYRVLRYFKLIRAHSGELLIEDF